MHIYEDTMSNRDHRDILYFEQLDCAELTDENPGCEKWAKRNIAVREIVQYSHVIITRFRSVRSGALMTWGDELKYHTLVNAE